MKKYVSLLCTTGIGCLQYTDLNATTVHSWAGLQDGRYDNLTLKRLVLEDDRMANVRRNVEKTEAIFIDEVSMLSRKDFEQLELVCRTVSNNDIYFGGLQVVACGDFYQLLPVPNTLYGDLGQFCFESFIWKSFFKHRINFDYVVRQNESVLISAVRETARGNISSETDHFLKSLERELPEHYNPVHLFASNYDASVFNNEKLQNLCTEEHTYEAIKNFGCEKRLKKILAPKYLHLKIGCPIILLRNIGGKLVNGLLGSVKGFSENDIVVHFSSICETHSLKRCNFSVFDTHTQSVIAERVQFPITLAYALTIHKSQGMTLESVYIHCRGIFESGQLPVALGRATNSVGIQLQHYRKGLCPQPKPVVTEYYGTPCFKFEDKLKCCQNQGKIYIPDVDIYFCESDDSDFNEEDLQILEEHVHINEDEIHLPEYINLENLKKSPFLENPFTEKQRRINEICLSVDDLKFKEFIKKNYKHLNDLLPCDHSKEQFSANKVWTELLSKYHQYVSSKKYKSTVSILFGIFSLTDEHFYSATQCVYSLLKTLIHNIATEIGYSVPMATCHNIICNAGKAKLRYVAGMCVAKARNHFSNVIQSNLGNPRNTAVETVKLNKTRVSFLRSLQASFDEIDTNDNTFCEIELCQNIRKGLTYVNEKCFQFFIHLNEKIRNLLNQYALSVEKENLFEMTKSKVKEDENIGMLCAELKPGHFQTEITSSVFDNLITRFLMVCHKQFLKDSKDLLSLKKKKAHRQEIKKNAGETKSRCKTNF